MEENDLESMRKHQAYPAKFLARVSEAAQRTLRDWISEQPESKVPLEVFDEFDFLLYMVSTVPESFERVGRERWNEQLRETVERLTWGIEKMGGEVCRPD